MMKEMGEMKGELAKALKEKQELVRQLAHEKHENRKLRKNQKTQRQRSIELCQQLSVTVAQVGQQKQKEVEVHTKESQTEPIFPDQLGELVLKNGKKRLALDRAIEAAIKAKKATMTTAPAPPATPPAKRWAVAPPSGMMASGEHKNVDSTGGAGNSNIASSGRAMTLVQVDSSTSSTVPEPMTPPPPLRKRKPPSFASLLGSNLVGDGPTPAAVTNPATSYDRQVKLETQVDSSTSNTVPEPKTPPPATKTLKRKPPPLSSSLTVSLSLDGGGTAPALTTSPAPARGRSGTFTARDSLVPSSSSLEGKPQGNDDLQPPPPPAKKMRPAATDDVDVWKLRASMLTTLFTEHLRNTNSVVGLHNNNQQDPTIINNNRALEVVRDFLSSSPLVTPSMSALARARLEQQLLIIFNAGNLAEKKKMGTADPDTEVCARINCPFDATWAKFLRNERQRRVAKLQQQQRRYHPIPTIHRLVPPNSGGTSISSATAGAAVAIMNHYHPQQQQRFGQPFQIRLLKHGAQFPTTMTIRRRLLQPPHIPSL